MSGTLPPWIAQWLGVHLPSGADGASWQLDSAWHWAPWATVALIVAAIAWTIALYARESTSARRSYRSLLIALRLVATGLSLAMQAQWATAIRITSSPTLVPIIDRSAS